MGIRNTTDDMRDPDEQMAFLAAAMVTGSASSFIGGQERDGQRQLLVSDRLPAKFNSGTQAEFEALGFTFGEPDKDDPMFRPATLPQGWSRKGSDHAMWSYLVDQHGRERVSIFYKAAFYDRDAFMNLIGLGWYVTKAVEYDEGPIIFDDKWATTEAVKAAMAANRDEELKRAADFRSYAADEKSRTADNRKACAEHASEHEAEAKAALYDAAIAAL